MHVCEGFMHTKMNKTTTITVYTVLCTDTHGTIYNYVMHKYRALMMILQ